MTTIRGPAALATALLPPVSTVCNPGLPESAYRACTKNQRATFPRPPVPYQHVAE